MELQIYAPTRDPKLKWMTGWHYLDDSDCLSPYKTDGRDQPNFIGLSPILYPLCLGLNGSASTKFVMILKFFIL